MQASCPERLASSQKALRLPLPHPHLVSRFILPLKHHLPLLPESWHLFHTCPLLGEAISAPRKRSSFSEECKIQTPLVSRALSLKILEITQGEHSPVDQSLEGDRHQQRHGRHDQQALQRQPELQLGLAFSGASELEELSLLRRCSEIP